MASLLKLGFMFVNKVKDSHVYEYRQRKQEKMSPQSSPVAYPRAGLQPGLYQAEAEDKNTLIVWLVITL